MRNNKWVWAAAGKHPAAKDYIRIGAATTLLDAVAQWAASGYEELNHGKGHQPAFHSWRFWLKGIKKGTLICGLTRDSSDSIGRPFPLVIMGEGTIRGWEKQWAVLPAMFEKTWNRMEFIASHRYADAREMEVELSRMIAPETGAVQGIEAMPDSKDQPCPFDVSQTGSQLADQGFAMIALNHSADVDPGQLVLQCHAGIQRAGGHVPRGVFVGGTPQHAYLAVIQHPLGAKDFVKLWTC